MIDLNTAWFVLFGVLITGYAILDGFDLGVGVLHLFAHDNTERRINLNAVGPVWDGNEVWLVTTGGALFAAFPPVYATIFSGFYIALMLVLAALIFRAVSLEFRGKIESPGWQRLWDWSFGLGSLLPSILFGVAVGNILRGVPIDANHMAQWASSTWIVFVVTYLLATMYTFFEAPHLMENIFSKPLFWVFMVALLASIAYQPVALKSKLFFRAFLSSSVSIASAIGIAAVSMYPTLARSSIDSAYSLTAYNACSTPRTLTTMLVITLIGMPIVIFYTIYIYRVFKGKTVITEESY